MYDFGPSLARKRTIVSTVKAYHGHTGLAVATGDGIARAERRAAADAGGEA